MRAALHLARRVGVLAKQQLHPVGGRRHQGEQQAVAVEAGNHGEYEDLARTDVQRTVCHEKDAAQPREADDVAKAERRQLRLQAAQLEAHAEAIGVKGERAQRNVQAGEPFPMQSAEAQVDAQGDKIGCEDNERGRAVCIVSYRTASSCSGR